MKKLITLVAVLAFAVTTAPPANAGSTSADFYISGFCQAKYPGDGSATPGAFLKWTNYDKGSGQEYHWSMSNSSGIWPVSYTKTFKLGGVLIDGSNPHEGYVYKSSKTTKYVLEGKWHQAGSPFDEGCSRTV